MDGYCSGLVFWQRDSNHGPLVLFCVVHTLQICVGVLAQPSGGWQPLGYAVH